MLGADKNIDNLEIKVKIAESRYNREYEKIILKRQLKHLKKKLNTESWLQGFDEEVKTKRINTG